MNSLNITTRRDFLNLLLAACTSRAVSPSVLAQDLPRDNNFQVRLSHLYTREDNQLRQVLLVKVPPETSASAIEAIVGKRSQKRELARLRKLAGEFYLPITPVEQPEDGRFILQGAGKSQETSLQVTPVRQWKVYLIHNSHQDPGFLDLPSKLRERFVPYIDDAMRFCAETSDWPDDAQFRWNIEVSYLMEDYRRHRGDEQVRQVMEWIKKGRMTIGGLYCSMNTDFMSLETLHRSVYYATNHLSREFGIKLDGAILDDVNGFTWGLVEVMAKSGLKYLVMGSNGDRDNMQNGNAPTLFYLEGPEGSRILIWRPVHYVEGFDLLTFEDPYTGRKVKGIDMSEGERTIARYFDRHERNGYPFDTVALQVASDFTPPFKQLSEVARDWNAEWAFPRLRVSTIAEFFQAMEAQHKDRIPCLRGGAPDGWVDLQLGEANTAALGRRLENLLPDVERLSTLAQWASAGPNRQAELSEAYHQLLLWEEHTIEWWDIRADIYVDEAEGGGKRHWEEKAGHARAADAKVTHISKETLQTLSRNVKTTSPHSLVVWNPLSWSRSEIVRTALPKTAGGSFRLVDLQSGREVPYQIRQREGEPDELVFLGANIPSLGYRTYSIESVPPAAGGRPVGPRQNSLDNNHFKLTLREKDGTVASLFDKELKREFVDPRAEHGFNQLIFRLHQRLTEREYRLLGEIPMQNVVISAGAYGPVYSSLKVSGNIEYICKFEHEIILYSDLKRVEFHNRIMKKPVYPKESVHYAFPFAVPTHYHFWVDKMTHQNTYKLDVPGAVMQPDLDQIPGSIRDNYVPRHWVSISRDDYGVLWSSIDAPVVQLGGIHTDKFLPWLTMQDDNWLARGWLYSLLMYNHWVVDVPIAQGGDYLFRYAVTTHGADWTYDDAHQFGWSFMSPLQAYAVEGAQTGEWSDPTRSFLEISPGNVYLAGFKAAEDGDGVILRLYEGGNATSSVRVRFNLPGRRVESALVCDARELSVRILESDSDSVRISLKPFETSTVRVRLA
ncbi:MAG: glycosyl hydrolase-related protein [Acidobacteriota bacterium]